MDDQLLRGRELDAAIATEVYGGSVNEHGWWLWGGADIKLPEFHKNDVECMGMVDEMVRRGGSYWGECYRTRVEGAPVKLVHRWRFVGPERTAWCQAIDADRRVAILNAALRAVRKEQGDE